FYAKQLAELITLQGKEILQQTVDPIQCNLNFEVIYGDTDSIMIYTRLDDINKAKSITGSVIRDIWFVIERKCLDMVRRDWSLLSKETGDFCLEQILSELGKDQGKGSSTLAGIAQHARHSNELKRDNKNLMIDIDYYLEQQSHLVVSSLCASIKGTSPSMLADCLGLDPSKAATDGIIMHSEAIFKSAKVHRKPPQSFTMVIEFLLESIITFAPPLEDKAVVGESSLIIDMEIDVASSKGKGKAIASGSEEKEDTGQESFESLAKVVFILKLLKEILLMYWSWSLKSMFMLSRLMPPKLNQVNPSGHLEHGGAEYTGDDIEHDQDIDGGYAPPKSVMVDLRKLPVLITRWFGLLS
nr:DNA polymerase alpha catalytic subunit [Tanacetum cinerariifolium]